MSYSIVYERQFVRLRDGRIIPLVLMGDNNVTEPRWNGSRSYERCARDWEVMFGGKNGKYAYTPDEIRDIVNIFVPSAYNQHFKFHSKWVDDDGFVKFFKNGIKNAKTLEELRDSAIPGSDVRLWCAVVYSEYTEPPKADPSAYRATTRRYGTNVNVSTTAELEAFIAEAEAAVAAKSDDVQCIYVMMQFPDEKPVKYPKRKNRAYEKQKAIEDSGHYFVLKLKERWYFKKLTSCRIMGSSNFCYAKLFASEKEARQYLSTHPRLTNDGRCWEIVEIKDNKEVVSA